MFEDSPCLFQERCGADTTVVKVRPGATIYLPEQRASFVYHLHSGVVGLFDISSEGQERMPVLVVPPNFIGFAAFAWMDGDRRPEHITQARAITSAVYCKTRREAVWALMDDREARAEIFNLIYSFILTIGTLTAAPFKHSTTARLLTLLHNLAERVGEVDKNGQIVIHGVSHDEIAAMIGTTRPTITRTLSKLKERGLLSTSWRSITVPNPAALLAQSTTV